VILPVVVVSLEGTSPRIERDIQAANEIWGREIEVWIELAARLVIDAPDLRILSQEDCTGAGHVVSDEEDQLFSFGRGLGADVVSYYIEGSSFGDNVLGCAAHPPDRRGFWLVHDSSFDFVWAHEVTHVVGLNPHVQDTDNLMFRSASGITNPPPDLDDDQRRRILDDPALFSVESIALNL
jgi:hypothetical protein